MLHNYTVVFEDRSVWREIAPNPTEAIYNASHMWFRKHRKNSADILAVWQKSKELEARCYLNPTQRGWHCVEA